MYKSYRCQSLWVLLSFIPMFQKEKKKEGGEKKKKKEEKLA